MLELEFWPSKPKQYCETHGVCNLRLRASKSSWGLLHARCKKVQTAVFKKKKKLALDTRRTLQFLAPTLFRLELESAAWSTALVVARRKLVREFCASPRR